VERAITDILSAVSAVNAVNAVNAGNNTSVSFVRFCDTRWNSGGHMHDELATFLSGN
jgi:hypothetical protein